MREAGVRINRRHCLALGLGLLAAPLRLAAADAPVVVFAAASLTDALGSVITQFERETGIVVQASYASSSALARQIEAGAPADLFLMADKDWMDDLQAHGRVRPGSRQDLLGNRLVLIVPRSSALQVRLGQDGGLAAALGDGHWVTGDPDAVPVGRYAAAALRHLGLWDAIASRLVRAEDTRFALAMVARGEATFGVVYETDARIEPRVRIVDTFPVDSHPPIIYPVALAPTASVAAGKLWQYLRSPAAAAEFRRYGFQAGPP